MTTAGRASVATDPDLIAECGLTTAHPLQGIAYAYIRFHWNPKSFRLGCICTTLFLTVAGVEARSL